MGDLSITAFDVLVVLVVLASAGYAVWRGLIRETLAVFSWVASGYVALLFGPTLAGVLQGAIESSWIRYPIAYLAIFLSVFVPISYLGHNIRQTVHRTPIGPVDRVLGFFYGAARGMVVIAAVYLVFTGLVPLREQPAWLTEARLYPVVDSTGDVLLALLPDQREPTLAEMGIAPAQAREAEEEEPAPAREQSGTTYDARERQSLDALIESTGGR
jgi:membrane protein required for colicin V production